tara:strand:+ start:4632 stop:5786 length:1155 start_codon:yes stop_codon:yes gene_type:complete
MAEGCLRILVVANLPPHVMGGAENQVARLVEAWVSSGAEVAVAGHRIPEGIQTLGEARIRTHHIRTWNFAGRLTRSLGYLLSLGRLVWRRRQDFDVVYCRGLADGALVISLLATIGICPWRFIATPINAGGKGDAYFLRSVPGWRLWCQLLNRRLDVINLINPLISTELDGLGLCRPARTAVPNGIVVQAGVSKERVGAIRRLIWTGRFEEQKGLDLLFNALAKCKLAGARFRLDLLGEGGRQESLRRLRDELGLKGEITFVGPVAQDDVRARLENADVFVLPSRYEGMSNSGLEAMEASLPVICTRCGGLDSHVETGAGWVCEPGDQEDLARVLMEMFAMSDDGLLAMGRQARHLIESRFDIRQVASANLAIMRALVAEEREV